MKRAILYFILLGLFFSNSSMHATTLSKSTGVKTAVHKIHNKKALRDGFSKKGSSSHKADLLNDYDDELDEYDCDDYNTSVKGKVAFSSTPINNQLEVNFISKTFCDKIYNHVNFSRLPRYNYISLRVLRL